MKKMAISMEELESISKVFNIDKLNISTLDGYIIIEGATHLINSIETFLYEGESDYIDL